MSLAPSLIFIAIIAPRQAAVGRWLAVRTAHKTHDAHE
jgi:hypothetical protein